ncbi:hypothetical protein Acsp03_48210 [Actinomadura sp. NBRC 104412]|uniref:hypothetical protein n=1 Tax=Actinomadura sp. NBRC 104412 TaxID=3032203 RepID=UPI0024A18699|nr:hypothetical protein [Actinomadura sp. NBRC 104412]GLZ07355.1 hypothetical protein Acsp03_48210 [Actinomadura sp. NBRC 104412]
MLSAVVATLLVGFAVYQLWGLRRQIKISTDALEIAMRAADTAQDAVREAARSADAAQDAVREAARVRIDEQAPRVVVLPEPVQWPPRLSIDRTSMPNRNQQRLFDAMSLHAAADANQRDYNFPEDGERLLWLIARALVINEGNSTARIRFHGEGRFIEGTSELLPNETITIPPVVGQRGETYLDREHLLRPGHAALCEWGTGHPLAKWAPVHTTGKTPECKVSISAEGSTEHGTLDQTTIEIAARPLEPIPGRDGQWRLKANPDCAVVLVHPTHRTYRNEA